MLLSYKYQCCFRSIFSVIFTSVRYTMNAGVYHTRIYHQRSNQFNTFLYLEFLLSIVPCLKNYTGCLVMKPLWVNNTINFIDKWPFHKNASIRSRWPNRFDEGSNSASGCYLYVIHTDRC